MQKAEILILGAGLMGRVAAHFFLNHPQGPYAVRLADESEGVLADAAKWLKSDRLETMRVNVRRDADLVKALEGIKVCQSCVPYFLNPQIAKTCLNAGVSMIDLGGNPEVTDEILAMNEQAKQKKCTLIPDTGLAPGVVSIFAWELVHRFKQCEEVHLRVGGLPQHPTGPLKYAQFFSVYGLLNEYLEDAREIRDGKVVTIPSLEEVESLSFSGYPDLEAFITSGGTSTLTKTLLGKVKRLDYKTIRYAGHANYLQFLRDTGLTDTQPHLFRGVEVSPREMLGRVLDNTLPKHEPDVVLVRVTAQGDGGVEHKIELIVKLDTDKDISAMGQLTAFPSAAIALAIYLGQVPSGAHPQEQAVSFAWMKEQLGLFGVKVN